MKLRYWLRYLGILSSFCLRIEVNAEPLPIQFGISEAKIVKDAPEKDQDFAFIIPGDLSTYIYEKEEDYYEDYQRSYFAVTCKKGGWDCLRHYEILANGCIPYFLDLDKCDQNTMHFLPKELIKEAMHLEGVSYLHIDHAKFNREKYNEILIKLLDHTRKFLTTKQIASYILKNVNYSGQGKILFLSTAPWPQYLRCSMLIGLKELLHEKVIDFVKVEHVYDNYSGDITNLYGRGMSYTKIITDIPIDRGNLEQRIADKEFELIIYGDVHTELPFFDLVQKVYKPEKIVYFCGEDFHQCPFTHLPNFFLREFEAYSGIQTELQQMYQLEHEAPSDINEHLPLLRSLARECSSAIEIGLRGMVSTWGILQGLAENPSPSVSYLGIDLVSPPLETLTVARLLAETAGISFSFLQANDMSILIPPTEMLFIDSLHTYCHLTYELEKFSPQVSKYIAMHDTSAPWGNKDDDAYSGDYSEYPLACDRRQKGLWPAVEDFLERHPEWSLHARHLNNHGFTILKRTAL